MYTFKVVSRTYDHNRRRNLRRTVKTNKPAVQVDEKALALSAIKQHRHYAAFVNERVVISSPFGIAEYTLVSVPVSRDGIDTNELRLV